MFIVKTRNELSPSVYYDANVEYIEITHHYSNIDFNSILTCVVNRILTHIYCHNIHSRTVTIKIIHDGCIVAIINTRDTSTDNYSSTFWDFVRGSEVIRYINDFDHNKRYEIQINDVDKKNIINKIEDFIV